MSGKQFLFNKNFGTSSGSTTGSTSTPYLSIASFTGYSATTETKFGVVQDEVVLLTDKITGYTGITETRFDVFNEEIVNISNNITGYTATTEPRLEKIYIFNNGGAPIVGSNIKKFIGSGTTDSSGLVIFNLTFDGTQSGNSIFSVVYSILATAQNDSTSITDIPLASIRSLTNDKKQLTVVAMNSSAIIMGGQGLEMSGAGIIINVEVIGT